MLRIAIVGPESSGKTTLASSLAEHYGTVWVEEVAREYLSLRGGAYKESDLADIAILQVRRGEELERDAPTVIFHDTEMITMKIWSQEKYGRVAEKIDQLVKEMKFDHWLLCSPDSPWEPDPLRENPHDRDRLFAVYGNALRSLGGSFTIIQGSHEQRMQKAVEVVDGLLTDRSNSS